MSSPQKKQWIREGGPWWPVTCWSKHRANNTTRRLHSSSNGWIEAYSIWCHSQTFHLFQGFLYTWLWKTGQKDGLSKLRWFWSWIHGSWIQPSTSPTEAWTAMSALHLPRLSRNSRVPWSLSKWKKLCQTWMQPWHKGDFSPSKRTGDIPVAIHYHSYVTGHPPRHTTSVGRMPNCCIFWKWAWRAGWKNLSFGFLSVGFFVWNSTKGRFSLLISPT